MMIGFEMMALAAAVTTIPPVGDWKITCADSAQLGDGLFDSCTMSKKSGPIAVEITRTIEGTSTLITQKGCKPPKPVPAATRTQAQLAEPEGNMALFGTVIEHLMRSQIACRAPGGAVAIPMTEIEATQLLAATAQIRGL